MIPSFPSFKQLTLDDRDDIYNFTRQYSPYSDFNFVSLYSWDLTNQTNVCTLNNNLVIKMKNYLDDHIFYSFLGSNEACSTIQTLIEISQQTSENNLYLIPEENLKNDNSVFTKYIIREDRNQFDYIHSVEEWANMAGSAYHNKRNLYRRFEKDNDYEVKILDLCDPNIQNQISQLFHTWENQKSQKTYIIEHELGIIIKACQIAKVCELVGIGVFADNCLVGFTISEVLGNGFCNLHFEKADILYRGLGEFLIKKTAEILLDLGCTQINYEQDLGIPGLREAKLLYNPHTFLKKYTISPKI